MTCPHRQLFPFEEAPKDMIITRHPSPHLRPNDYVSITYSIFHGFLSEMTRRYWK